MFRKHFLSLTNTSQIDWPVLVLLMVLSVSAWAAPSVNVPLLESKLKVDGKLDEACRNANRQGLSRRSGDFASRHGKTWLPAQAGHAITRRILPRRFFFARSQSRADLDHVG